MCDSNYFKKQIITYMGNKRKLLGDIEETLIDIQKKLNKNKNKNKMILGDGFSGSGIVSRLFKQYGKKIYTNDLAGYSKTLNECYLANPSPYQLKKIKKYVDEANAYADSNEDNGPHFIRTHWAPKNNTTIKKDERAYFTHENGVRIDKYRYFINQMPKKYRSFLLAPLLVACSICNNTSGHFAAFYKKGDTGHFGGKKEVDVGRITRQIRIEMPIFCINSCESDVSQEDVCMWAKNTKNNGIDIVYYDPPYNKHPYNIYYFLLDIINDWDVSMDVPETLRGQPKNWKQSLYNSISNAKKEFNELIQNTNAQFIIVSYNNGGIISFQDMENILKKKGIVHRKDIEHKTYNRLKGIANYRRKKDKVKIRENLWIVDCR